MIYNRGCEINGENCEIKCLGDSCNKLHVYDWLKDYPSMPQSFDIAEIRFKNTRKGFYKNVNNLPLKTGDVVAVEASPGHDIGIVSLTGELVFEQMRKNNAPLNVEYKKIYRKAKQVDIEKWKKALEQEDTVMFRARQIASNLKLDMKIGDVEFQGDGTKAIFYYIADERVDFRELIKIFAEEFRVRIEMRQIGARQEAGRIGGIGSCGRELCCGTWISNFVSVTTNAARFQELSLNPQKLAGQCGKLKCCLNFEVNAYIDARKDFPDVSIPIETREGRAYHQKTDIFKRIMWYSVGQNSESNLVPVPIEKVFEYLELNKKNIIIESIAGQDTRTKQVNTEFESGVGQDSVTRFEDKRHKKKKKHKRRPITNNLNNNTNNEIKNAD